MSALTPSIRVLEHSLLVYRRTWRGSLFTTFLAMRFRLHLSPSSVRRLLHTAGWRWRSKKAGSSR